MGSIINARDNRSPVVVTAGQQSRSMMARDALLTNRDATTLPKPAVKWSHEPASANEVPSALARALHLAATPPRGPVFLSLPMDDWDEPTDVDPAALAGRSVTALTALPDEVARGLARAIDEARSPALVVGGEVDALGGWDAAIALAEKARLPVWAAAVEGRVGFPESHPNFQGALPPAMGPTGQLLAQYDLVVVLAAPVFRYYPDLPGDVVAEGTRVVQVTSDPDEAARALTGDAHVATPAAVAAQLAALVSDATERERPPQREPAADPPEQTPMHAGTALQALARVLPQEALCVSESPSSALAFRNYVRTSQPNSYLFGAGGGLGFGLAAAVGAQLGAPDRPVVAVLGEGSAQYTIQALWSAVAYEVPVTIVILRNDEYAILKWFSQLEQVEGAPGLDLPGLDCVGVARGYGMKADRVEDAGSVGDALSEAIAAPEPRLLEIAVAPGMAV
jgi:benzoylformate decarboxylase